MKILFLLFNEKYYIFRIYTNDLMIYSALQKTETVVTDKLVLKHCSNFYTLYNCHHFYIDEDGSYSFGHETIEKGFL